MYIIYSIISNIKINIKIKTTTFHKLLSSESFFVGNPDLPLSTDIIYNRILCFIVDYYDFYCK